MSYSIDRILYATAEALRGALGGCGLPLAPR